MATLPLNRLVGRLRQSLAAARLDEMPDRDLLGRFLAREDAAGEALVRRYGPTVLTACRRVLTEEADIDDAFQATFLALLQHGRTIRRQALGGWLAVVAHRVAVQARIRADRRRRHEHRAGTQIPDAAKPSWREAVAVLHEELDRLPERYRRPLLLCYLDGRSRDEAAALLGWSAGAVKGRLERGRALLGRRLRQRGIALSAGLFGVVTVREARALPPGLVRSTLAAAGRPSAAVAGLAGAVRGRPAVGGWLVAAAALVAGVIAVGKPQPAAVSADPPPAVAAPADTVVFRGQVLDPAGKPVPRARVYFQPANQLNRSMMFPGRYRTLNADEAGRFRMEVPRAELSGGHTPMILAVADGFGSTWEALSSSTGTGADGVTLRLSPDQTIEGRVINLEGRPLAGVTLRIAHALRFAGDDLGPWLALRKNPTPDPKMPITHQAYPPDVPGDFRAVTNADGRFRLAGAGREREVVLLISGPTVAAEFVTVLTRPGLDLRPYNRLPTTGHFVFGPRFDYVARPARPVAGTVRERGTGRPLPGVTVWGLPAAGAGNFTVTDERGRFRLLGLSPAPKLVLVADSDRSRGFHLGAERVIEYGPGLEEVTADLELERAVVITGRFTERGSGRPVRGRVQYVPLAGNLFAARPGVRLYPMTSDFAATDADGRYRILAMPGPGILVAEPEYGDPRHNPYVTARASAADRARPEYTRLDQDHEGFKSFQGGSTWIDVYNAYRLLDLPEGMETFVWNPELVRGGSVTLKLVGPDGQPVTGAIAAGLGSDYYPDASVLTGDNATVVGLEVDRPRSLAFAHRDRNLAAALTLGGNEVSPLTVRLRPGGTITGRVLDPDGKPLAEARVAILCDDSAAEALLRFLRYSEDGLGTVRTDRDGRFRFTALLPGVKYRLGLSRHPWAPAVAERVKDLATAGETKDLGDLATVRAGR